MTIENNKEDKKILEECCKENNVDIKEIEELMELEKEYETQTRRFGINGRIRSLIEDQFCKKD